MENLMTTGIMITCILCYVCQGLSGKLYATFYDGEPNDATPVYSALYGLIVGIGVWVVALHCRLTASASTWWMGIFNGVVLFLYNLSVINASRKGPFGFQCIFRTFGAVVVPMVFSLAFWGDTLSWLQGIGIAVMLISFVLINYDGLALRGAQKGYIGWVVLSCIVNGTYAVLMAAQQRAAVNMEGNEMIVITFLSSASISLLNLACRRKKGFFRAFRMCPKAWASALSAGTAAALAVVQLMILIGRMESLSVLYTIQNGMILVLVVVFSAILFKEKISRKAAMGIALSVISLALLSM